MVTSFVSGAKAYIKGELEPEGTTTVADLGFRFRQITVIACVVTLFQTASGLCKHFSFGQA